MTTLLLRCLFLLVGDIVGTMPFPRFWQAELKSPTGNTSATLFLNTYLGNDEAPQGYVVTGPGGKKPEISEAHQDGDMLGFDMTVQGLNGKPLKISVLGKSWRVPGLLRHTRYMDRRSPSAES